MAAVLSVSLASRSLDERPDAIVLSQYLRDGDPTAFATLVRRHGGMILGVCRRMIGDHHLAEDAFQAVCVVFARKAATVRPAERLPAWLYGVAYRVALRARSLNLKHNRREQRGVTMPERETTAAEPEDLNRLLDDAIAELPEYLRDAVVLCELDGLSRAEAAVRLKIPEGTLSSRLATARKKLAAILKSKGVVLSAGALVMQAVVSPQIIAAAVRTVSSSHTLSPVVQSLVHGALSVSLLQKLKLAVVGLVALVGLSFGLASAQPLADDVFSPVALLKDPVPKSKDPTWDRFRAICGDTEGSRILFKEMLGEVDEEKTLREADSSDAKAFATYKKDYEDLDKRWNEKFQEFLGQPAPRPGQESHIAAANREIVKAKHVLHLLFLGSRVIPGDNNDLQDHKAMLASIAFFELAKGPQAKEFGQLVAAWAKPRKGTVVRQQALTYTTQARITALLPQVREEMKTANEKTDPHLLGQALFYLGNLGDESDLPSLFKHRADERAYQQYRNTQANPLFVSDVSIAMMLKLKGKSLGEYGFSTTETYAWWNGPKPLPVAMLYEMNANNRKVMREKTKPILDEIDQEIREKARKTPNANQARRGTAGPVMLTEIHKIENDTLRPVSMAVNAKGDIHAVCYHDGTIRFLNAKTFERITDVRVWTNEDNPERETATNPKLVFLPKPHETFGDIFAVNQRNGILFGAVNLGIPLDNATVAGIPRHWRKDGFDPKHFVWITEDSMTMSNDRDEWARIKGFDNHRVAENKKPRSIPLANVPGDTTAYWAVRGHEIHLICEPPLSSPGTKLIGHDVAPTVILTSQDNHRIVSLDESNTLIVWKRKTNFEYDVVAKKRFETAVKSVALTPNGKELAVGLVKPCRVDLLGTSGDVLSDLEIQVLPTDKIEGSPVARWTTDNHLRHRPDVIEPIQLLFSADGKRLWLSTKNRFVSDSNVGVRVFERP